MEKSVSNTTPKSIADACIALGVDVCEILSKANVSKNTLKESNGKTSFEKVIKIWEEAEKQTQNKVIGLAASEFLPFGAVKVVDYIMVASSTSKESIDKLLNFYPLINSVFKLTFETNGNFCSIKLHNPTDSKLLPPQYVNYVLACVAGRIKFASAGEWKPSKINLTSSNSTNLSEYHRTFQSQINFNQAFNEIVFKQDFLEIAQPNHDPRLCEILDAYAQKQLSSLSIEDDLLYQLENILRKSIHDGNFDLNHSARKLGMSRRSLQRKLKTQGISYQILLNQIRRDLAIDLLRENRKSVEEIGFLVGYSEKSSFYKAFKNWTGKTPKDFL